MFETLKAAPSDPILGLSDAFRSDPNPNKINLTVGVYKDETGTTPILASVKEAERRMLASENSKGYLPIDGDAGFARATRELFFGADHEVVTSGRAATAHTPGGTGALRVTADFLKQNLPSTAVWCSTPTWPNHPKIFQAAGLAVKSYAYFDTALRGASIDAMLESIATIPAGDVICLHACCHNPTGADPTTAQWKQIADAVYERGIVPLLDFAYLGFGDGISEDCAALREFSRPGVEFFVCSSYSKNFGLYSERVGAVSVVTRNADSAKVVASQIKSAIRTNYSNPPKHGGAVVETILTDPALRAQWERELADMRNRINGMRKLFTKTMAQVLPGTDFSHIERQRGMFSYSGLTAEQVDKLRSEHAIYAVRDGRINVAGISESNCEVLCQAIAAVL